jgi:hypothetical protein
MLDRIKAWCWHSITIFWSYVQFVIGGIIAIFPLISDTLSDPDVKAQILAWVPGQRHGIALMVIAIVTAVARFRTL